LSEKDKEIILKSSIPDVEKTQLIYCLETSYSMVTNTSDTCLLLAREALNISDRSENAELIAITQIQAGRIHALKGLLTSAGNHSMNALAYFEKKDNDIHTAELYTLIGDMHRASAQYDKSLEYLISARDMCHKGNFTSQLPYVHNKLSASCYEICHTDLENFDFTVLKRSLPDLGALDEREYWNKLVKIYADSSLSANLDDASLNTETWNLLGAFCRNNKDYDQAIESFSRALETSRNAKVFLNEALYLFNISESYLLKKDFKLAMAFGDSAYNIAQNAGFAHFKWLTARNLSRIHKELGDFEKSLNYSELAMKFYEQHVNRTSHHELIEITAYYENQKKESEIAFLQAEKDHKTKVNIYLYMTVGLLSLSLILIFLVVRYRRKVKKQ
jgi:tetratricopeptide (TPR) repeat protein